MQPPPTTSVLQAPSPPPASPPASPPPNPLLPREIIEAIVRVASRDALLSLRPVCRWIKNDADKYLFHHVTIKAGKKERNDQDAKVKTCYFTDINGKRLPLSAFQIITATTGRCRSVFCWSPDEYMGRKKRAQAMRNIRTVDYPIELARRRELYFGSLTTARVFFNESTLYWQKTGIWVMGVDTLVLTGHMLLHTPPGMYNRGSAACRTSPPTRTVVLNVVPQSPHYCSGHAERFSKEWANFNLVVVLSPCTFATNGAYAAMCFARQFFHFVDDVRRSDNRNSITLVGVQEFLQSTYHSLGGTFKGELELDRLLGHHVWQDCSDEHQDRIEKMIPELARMCLVIEQYDVACKTFSEYKEGLTAEQANLQLSGYIIPPAPVTAEEAELQLSGHSTPTPSP